MSVRACKQVPGPPTDEQFDSAIEHNDAVFVRLALHRGFVPTAKHLEKSIKENKKDVFDALMAANCTMNANCLWCAVVYDRQEMIKALRAAGCTEP